MKLLKGLTALFLLFTIVSCATTEKGTDVNPSDNSAAQEGSPEKKKVEKEVEETLYFVSKEKAFYGDGQIDTLTDYSYNDNFELVSRVQTNEQAEVLESNYNTIEGSVVVRRDNYGFSNVLNNYTTFEYNQDGMVVVESMFDSEDKLQSKNEYEYNGMDLILWKTLGPSEGVLAITEYEYDSNHNNTKVIMKDALGAVDGEIEKTYQDNMLIEEKVIDAKGSLEKSTQYIYDGDILVEKVYFDKKGKKKRSESYEFTNEQPVPNRVNLLYSSGDLDAYTLYEYVTKVVKTTILVEE